MMKEVEEVEKKLVAVWMDLGTTYKANGEFKCVMEMYVEIIVVVLYYVVVVYYNMGVFFVECG